MTSAARGRPAYFVGPWDLNRDLSCVPQRPADGTVVLVESRAKSQALPYHRKKLVFVLSAMHHFAAELREAGFDVHIVNASTYVEGIASHVESHGSTCIVALEPREWGLSRAFDQAVADNRWGVPLDRHDDGGPGGHFLLSRAEFRDWAGDRARLRMADFYKWMRIRTGYLVKNKKPEGGKWSFDAENRKPARGHSPPEIPRCEPDAMTRQQIDRVAKWKGHWGEAEGFSWPVTRQDALRHLDIFFEHRAESFGRFQDAMLAEQPFMWHSLISPAMNVGLLSPREVCERIVNEYASGRIPLASAEGLLRQILGWREFIRGVYWRRMPELRAANLLDAQRPLPDFFWEPDATDMTCLRESIGQVKETGYAHHIQRLMVQGNFALLAGVHPLEISHWFWAAFVDAYEWVELPNVHGMAVFADDTFTTKPYAASGKYIQRMSDYCGRCPYDVKARHGAGACPFNPLFWSFMHRHRDRLEANPRLRMLYRNWDRLDDREQKNTLESAEKLLSSYVPAEPAWRFRDDEG